MKSLWYSMALTIFVTLCIVCGIALVKAENVPNWIGTALIGVGVISFFGVMVTIVVRSVAKDTYQDSSHTWL